MMRFIALVATVLGIVAFGIVHAQTVTVSCPGASPLVDVVEDEVGSVTTIECGEAWTPTPEPEPTETETPTLEPTWTETATLVPTATRTPTSGVLLCGSLPCTRTPTSTATALPPSVTPISTPPVVPFGALIVPDQYSTIGAAVTAASIGGTVAVRAGTYLEQVGISKAGLTLMAYGDGPAVIDGGCVRNYGVVAARDDISVIGLVIQNTVVSGVFIDGFNVNPGPNRATVRNNTITDFNCQEIGPQNYAGVRAYYAGANHVISGNTIIYRTDGRPLRGAGNGIWFKSDSGRPSGGGHTITDNTIIGGYDGIGGETEGSSRGSFDRNTLIARNYVQGCWDDGIQVEGGNLNVSVQDNRIEECSLGIAFAPNLLGPLYIERNTIVSSSPRPGDGTLACYKVGNTGQGTAFVTANVCQLAAGGDGFKQTNSGLSPIVSRSNRFVVGRYVFEFTSTPPGVSSFDSDCMQTSDTTRFVKWGGSLYASLASFRSATGQEMSGTIGPC